MELHTGNARVCAQSCTTICNPMDCRLPGSSIHGISQARVLEWGAIAFSVDAPIPKELVLPCLDCIFKKSPFTNSKSEPRTSRCHLSHQEAY